MSGKSTLFLIPSSLNAEYSGDQVAINAIPEISHLRHFAVENIRHARRYLRQLLPDLIIDECTFYEMGKHAGPEELEHALQVLKSGSDIGVISEAGLPGVADPGNNIVAGAHQQGFRVKPIIGPGSVFLALMASGFNGQEFTFHGYLPRENQDRSKKLKDLEQTLNRTGYTQIFMETPYRNEQLLADILKSCLPSTGLCIACAITTPDEYIRSMTVAQWKKEKTDLHKKPAIFLIGRM